jgi:hypothetical protein
MQTLLIFIFYWQLNSVIAIIFSCIDSIDCSPFSRNLADLSYRFFYKQSSRGIVERMNSGHLIQILSHELSTRGNLIKSYLYNCSIQLGVCFHMYPNFQSASACNFKTAHLDLIFLAIAVKAFDFELFCRPVTWTICIVESWTASRQPFRDFILTIAFVFYEVNLFIRPITNMAYNYRLPHIESLTASWQALNI